MALEVLHSRRPAADRFGLAGVLHRHFSRKHLVLLSDPISCCLSEAFSASSRLLDLKSAATRFKERRASATIAASVRQFLIDFNANEVFGTHSLYASFVASSFQGNSSNGG